MNPATIIGMIAGLALVGLAIVFTSDNAMTFINLPGLMIVLGGTVAATFVSFPPGYVLRVWSNFLAALRNEHTYDRDDIDEIAQIARLWREGKIAPVEAEIAKVRSPFLRTGLTLIVDGAPIDDINDLLEWRAARLKAREYAEANVFRAMGSYAPAFGMLGTLIGLVNMLYDMSGEGFDNLGLNMAVALITSFYGILLANMIFNPIAEKLEDRTQQRLHTLSMAQEAVNLVSRQRSPTYIRETLYSFLSEYEGEDEVYTARSPAS